MNFQELLGGVGKEFMNAAGEALAGAAKEYLGNAIQEIFVKKEADTKRTLSNIQHMKVVSSAFILPQRRIMGSIWRLLGDIARQRLVSYYSNNVRKETVRSQNNDSTGTSGVRVTIHCKTCKNFTSFTIKIHDQPWVKVLAHG